MNRITYFSRRLFVGLAVFASMAPFALRAYLVGPAEGLDKMATNADLVCKARVVDSTVITNEAFQPVRGFETRATRLEIISTLKGSPPGRFIVFQHYAPKPQGMMAYSPQSYELGTGRSYLIFAVKAESAGVFRQIRFSHTMKSDEGVLRTLNDRPLSDIPVKDAHWHELALLLQNADPTNQLYAVQQLDSMSKGCGYGRAHGDDFPRETVLKALAPIIASANDEVAVAALKCFHAGPECLAQITPYADTLVEIASRSPSVSRRVTVLAALSGTKFAAVSNALPQWLADPSEDVRLQAILLLPDFPGEFSGQVLRTRADDPSPRIRAGVADAIGNGKIGSLLPTLEKLLVDPVGRTNPIPPLTGEQLQAGGRVGGNNNGVHTAAGYALLKFDVNQVGDILKANLNDEVFRPYYLCKLAEKDAGPWLTNLVGVLEVRRHQVEKEAAVSGVEPRDAYIRARMALAGTYHTCWHIIAAHLQALPPESFANGSLNHCLDVLENAGDTGSQEPVAIYELYRTKGLHQRAAQFRKSRSKEIVGYDLGAYFDKVDSRLGLPTP